jgi:Flp pilus assembly protein TadB
MGYGLKLGGAMIAFLLLGVLAILIFGSIWMRVGFGAAAVLGIAVLVFFAWRSDRKAKELRTDLPPV